MNAYCYLSTFDILIRARATDTNLVRERDAQIAILFVLQFVPPPPRTATETRQMLDTFRNDARRYGFYS